jgi:hypothetical protein
MSGREHLSREKDLLRLPSVVLKASQSMLPFLSTVRGNVNTKWRVQQHLPDPAGFKLLQQQPSVRMCLLPLAVSFAKHFG